MKTKTINLYHFDELAEHLQRVAIRELGDINVDHNWWTFVYEDFIRVAETFGIEVHSTDIHFSGFHHQGQGSSYRGVVDVAAMIRSISRAAWMENCIYRLDLPNVSSRSLRIARLINSGAINWNVWIKPLRSMSIDVQQEYYFRSYNPHALENLTEALIETEALVSSVCHRLNGVLFKAIYEDYDYLTGDQAIKETIIANDYYFNKFGKIESEEGD